MARAEAASASARADSIKGLAQSIANPAYRRLLTAEPALRRAVPALIIAFLLTIGVGAVVQVLDHHRQAIAEATHDIDNVADFVVGALRPAGRRGKGRHHAARSAGARALDPRHRLRPPHPAQQRRRRHHRDRSRRRPDRLAPDRRARRDAAADHPRRQRRRARNHARRRQPGLRDGADAGRRPRPVERLPVAERCARALALRHHADRHAHRHHRLRAADPRLCLPLAGHPRARGRRDLRHRAQPHRHRAQPRPLRPVGLGPRPRPHLLVAFDVRDPGPRAARRPDDLRRGQPARSSRRHQALRGRGPARRRQDQRHRP